METLIIDNEELAQEFAKRVVKGLLSVARGYVPTVKDIEDKAQHIDVAVYNGLIYIGTEHALYSATIEPRIHELCKKKSQLRTMLEELGPNWGARLNYGTASPWLKTHEKNVKRVEIGVYGIRLIVVEGVVELDMMLTDANIEYAVSTSETIAAYTAIESPETYTGCQLVWEEQVTEDTIGFNVGPDSVTPIKVYEPAGTGRVGIDLIAPPSLLPGKDCSFSAMRVGDGTGIVCVTTVTPEMTIDQFFRIIDAVPEA